MDFVRSLRTLILTLFGFAAPLAAAPTTSPLAIAYTAPGLPADIRTGLLDSLTTGLGSPIHRRATIGLALADVETSEILLEWRADERMIPASVTKIFTTAYALERLGPDFCFSTELYATSRAQIVLAGGLDPTLGSNRVNGAETSVSLVTSLAAALDAHLEAMPQGSSVTLGAAPNPMMEPIPGPWDWEDLGDYYGAGVHRLNWHDNLFFAEFQPAAQVGEPATLNSVYPSPVWTILEGPVRTGPKASGDRASFRLVFGKPALRVIGTVPQQSAPFTIKGTLPEPDQTLLRAIRAELSPRNRPLISVQGLRTFSANELRSDAKAPHRILWRHKSPPLSSIVETIHKQSFNMYAETLLVAPKGLPEITQYASQGTLNAWHEGTTDRNQFLQQMGLDTTALRLRDGSGLSTSNRISARETVRFLLAMGQHPHYKVWHDSLATFGVDGDLKGRRGPGNVLQGNIRAKTGLITGSRALTGYLTLPRTGKTLAFAILVQNADAPWTKVDESMDQTLAAILQVLDKEGSIK